MSNTINKNKVIFLNYYINKYNNYKYTLVINLYYNY